MNEAPAGETSHVFSSLGTLGHGLASVCDPHLYALMALGALMSSGQQRYRFHQYDNTVRQNVRRRVSLTFWPAVLSNR